MLRTISLWLTALVVIIGGLVLIGWTLNITLFKSVLPGLDTMKANTAICFLLSGASLGLYLNEKNKRLYWIPLLPLFLLSTLSIWQYSFNVNLGVDQWLFKDTVTAPENFPGRMSLFSAVSFIVYAIALIWMARGWLKTGQGIIVLANSFATIVLLSYIFDSQILEDASIFSTMALHTALGFAILGTAILFTHPESDLLRILNDRGSAGKLLRRNVLFAFAVPIVLGILTSLARYADLISYPIGLAVLIQTMIVIILFSLWRNAYLIQREDEAQEQHEADLTDSREKFMSIFQEVSDVILIIDGEVGNILSANPACGFLLGYTPEELIGKHFRVLFKDTIEIGFLDKVTFVRDIMLEQPIRKADGSFLSMDLTTKVILWEGNRAVLVTLRDASERIQMQDELVLSRLKQIEMEKEHELVNMKEAFIAGISHDFKNPLSVISLSSDILHRYYDRLNLEQTLSHLERIRFQAHFMKEMIDDIMTFVESHQGEMITQMQLVNLTDLCNNIINDIGYQYPDREIRFMHARDIGSLALDPRLMRRAITNLLSNALKYSADNKPVTLRLRREDNHVLIEVEDQGIGIPEKDAESLFTPFHRASNVTNIKGTGLGLVIVRDCMSVHEGSVSFKSEEGKGTTFTLRIPFDKNTPTNITSIYSA